MLERYGCAPTASARWRPALVAAVLLPVLTLGLGIALGQDAPPPPDDAPPAPVPTETSPPDEGAPPVPPSETPEESPPAAPDDDPPSDATPAPGDGATAPRDAAAAEGDDDPTPGDATPSTPGDAPETAKAGKLTVVSNPGEAEVFVDGRYAGATPELTLDLAAGDHEITVVKRGHILGIRKVSVDEGGDETVAVELAPDVEIPFGLVLKYAPKFSESRDDGERIVHALLLAIVNYFVEERDPRDLLLKATEAMASVVGAVRAREVVLRETLDDDARKRFYIDEIDLRDYPELTVKRRATANGGVEVTVRGGDEKLTHALSPDDMDTYIEGFRKVFRFIRDQWDVENKLTDDMVYHAAVEGMIDALDDEHTHFLPPAALEELQTDTAGEFGGLGIVVSVRDRQLTVIAPIDGTPAHAAGIQSGDRIASIDGDTTRELTLQQAVRRMRGEEGTKVVVGIKREGEPDILEIPIVRGIIKIRYLRSRMLDGLTGYVRVTSFIGETLEKDFTAAIDELEAQGMGALVIDLRGNPGGLLEQAWRLADQFTKSGTIVSTRTRGGEERERIRARAEGTRPSYPVAVLVDGGSASASEIFSGVLQDNRRAVTIGEKTFGKGSVQRVIPLEPYDVAFALTIATYHLPSGRTPHKVGITPDVVIELDRETRTKLANRSVYDAEWDWDPAEDPHLARALDLLETWRESGERPELPAPKKTDDAAGE